MQINEKNIETTDMFYNLKAGVVFKFHGQYYMKLNDGLVSYAVNLHDGIISVEIDDYSEVYIVDAELNIIHN